MSANRTVRSPILATIIALTCLSASGCGDTTSKGDTTITAHASDVTDTADTRVAHDAAPDAGDPDASENSTGLPVIHRADASLAREGRRLLFEGGLQGPRIPMRAIRNLWLVWGTGQPADDADLWREFNHRYGTISTESGQPPLGVHVDGDSAEFSCLTCHADRVAGEVTVGVGNSLLDLEALYDDLRELRKVASNYGISVPAFPDEMKAPTGAAGAVDGFGMGMQLSTEYAPGDTDIHTRYGYQQAPMWWTIKFRDRVYTDGASQTGGYRTMMATSLGFGTSIADLKKLDDEFRAVHHYLLSLEAPGWPFAEPDPASVKRGKALFDRHCASCHGTHTGPDARYPNRIEPVDAVGTDPVRTDQFTQTEASWVNASWIGKEHPMTSTDGYLAPPLVGVWASAPYFHNGSVPTLAGVLDSSARPDHWRRTGRTKTDYDPDAVGWRYTVETPRGRETRAQRRTYDTSTRGLDNRGHTYGDQLDTDERAALLDYLKTL